MSEQEKQLAVLSQFVQIAVAAARGLDVCRICGRRGAREGNPVVLDFGREYAHEQCLAAVQRLCQDQNSLEPTIFTGSHRHEQ